MADHLVDAIFEEASWQLLQRARPFIRQGQETRGEKGNPYMPSGNQADLRYFQQKAQLGRFAHEDRMPDWLIALLQQGGQRDQAGMASTCSDMDG